MHRSSLPADCKDGRYLLTTQGPLLIDVKTYVLVVRGEEKCGGKTEHSSKYEIQITLESYFVMEVVGTNGLGFQ